MKVETYAIIDSNDRIINTVLWDGNTSKWSPPIGTTAVLLKDATNAISIKEKYTAEQWLTKCGYTPLQLVTLLDLEAKLSNANLKGAYLNYAKLSIANLVGADLHGASFLDANLLYANFQGANLKDAIMIEGWKLTKVS